MLLLVGSPAGIFADCMSLRDYSASRLKYNTRIQRKTGAPNVLNQYLSSFGVVKWLMLIVLINNSKSWSGTSSAQSLWLCTESAVNNESTCPVEPRDRGPAADMWTVNKLVGREVLAAAELSSLSGRQRPAKCGCFPFPRWGDFVSFIWQEQRGWEAENSFIKASPVPY